MQGIKSHIHRVLEYSNIDFFAIALPLVNHPLCFIQELLERLDQKKRIACVLLLAIVFPVISAQGLAADDTSLPLLGENAAFQLKRELEIGQKFYQRLVQKGLVIDDALLSHYLSDVGEALLSSVSGRLRDYHFFLVNDTSVNAFATPGGYIGVNLGLIALTRSEDELASVLAHEISHVKLRHTMQMIEKSEDVSMASMLSILTAILLSSTSPDAATALIYTGAAGSAQAMVNFTRTNEYEADRVGVNFLKGSEYNPLAMVDFMALLKQSEQSGALSNIEYLRTHPINSNRVAEIQSRLQGYENNEYKSVRYQQFKDYLLYKYAPNLKLGKKTPFYQALIEMKNGNYQQAEDIYKALAVSDPDSFWYKYARAENYLYQDRQQQSIELFESMLLLYPDNYAIGEQLVKIYLNTGENDKALRLIDLLGGLAVQNPKVYQLKSDVYTALGDEPLRRLAEADYHWFNNNKKYAKKQYKVLLREENFDIVTAEKIKQRIDKK